MVRTSASWTRSLTPSARLRSPSVCVRTGAGRAHRRQDVGQVQLALGVVGAQGLERVEQRGPVEREDRAVDLADRELLRGRVAGGLRLDDALDVAVVVAHDAAVAGRVVEHHRRHRGGGAVLGVRPHERASIAAGVTSGTSPGSTRTASSASICPAAAWTAPPVPSGSGCTTRVTPSGSLPSSGWRPSRRPRRGRRRPQRGGDRPADERAPAERVQHLRKLGAHAGALAGGEDDGGEGGHGVILGAATVVVTVGAGACASGRQRRS